MKIKFSLFVKTIACLLLCHISYAQQVETLALSGHGGGGNQNQMWYDIAVDGAGRRFVCGQFEGTGTDFGTGPGFSTNINAIGNLDASVAAYDPTDQLLWAVQIGGVNTDAALGISVSPDINNQLCVFVTGYFTGTNVGITLFLPATTTNLATLNANSGVATDITYFLMKFNDAGQLLWSSTSSGAGVNAEEGRDVSSVRVGNNIIVNVCGRYANQASFSDAGSLNAFVTPAGNPNDWEGFVLNYRDNGNTCTILWGNTIRAGAAGNINQRHDIAQGITSDERGGAIVTGQITLGAQFSSGATLNALGIIITGTDDIFVSRYNELGVLLWGMRMGGPGTSTNVISNALDCGRSVALDRNGLIYVTGFYSSNSSTNANFGGLNMTGTNVGLINSQNFNDIFVVRLNDSGANLSTPPAGIWVRQIASAGRDFPTDLCVDNCGIRLFLSGSFWGTTLNFPSGQTLPMTAFSTAGDGFFCELDATSGNDLVGTPTIAGGLQWEMASSIDINAVGDVSVCGYFNNTNITVGTLNIANSNSGFHDAFIARWDNIMYPVATPPTLTHGGIGVSACNVFTSGTIQGSATVAFTAINSNAGSSDVYLIRSNHYGNPNLFIRLTDDPINTTVSDEDVIPVQGNILVAGFTNTGNGTVFIGSPVTSSSASRTGFVCETNTNGLIQWVVLAESTGASPGPASCWAVSSNANGEVYVCGNFTGGLQFRTPGFIPGSVIVVPAGIISAGQEDYYVAKFDSQGHLLWCVSGGGPLNDNATDLKSKGGELYVTGQFRGTAAFNANGGGTGSLTASSGADGFVLRMTDNPGPTPPTLTSRAAFGLAVGDDVGTGVDAFTFTDVVVASANINGVTTTGNVRSFNMTSAVVPSPTWSNLIAGAFLNGIATANQRIFTSCTFAGPLTVYSFAMNGTALCNLAIPTYEADMAVLQGNTYGDDGENILIAGNIPSTNVGNISRVSSHGCGIASRLSNESGEPTQAFTEIKSVLYPNPSNGYFTLKRNTIQSSTLQIIDLSGRLVFELNNITATETTVDCGSLPQGLYIYRIITGESIESGKIILTD